MQSTRAAYAELGAFLFFFVAYVAVLYLQCRAGAGYEVRHALLEAFAPKDAQTGAYRESFNGVPEIYEWIGGKIIDPNWADAVQRRVDGRADGKMLSGPGAR
jgi:hypothetical protein